MSQTQMLSVQPRYSPMRDVVHRHEGGVSKSKKIALTGSGRAWREDEEAYLLQTRLQKMPYKHIAAHLNKTELACRLHYHQLSHGSTRRKRATSCSSGSSDPASSHAGLAPSPRPMSKSRSLSPAMGMGGGYMPTPPTSDMQLPSIMTSDRPARLPAILPKPEPMGYPPLRSESPQRYPMTMEPTHEGLAPPVSLSRSSTPFQSPGPPLRLDCGTGSRYSSPSAPVHGPRHVDLPRLQAIYEAHRSIFWTAVADEYGANVPPMALEQAWKTGSCCPQRGGSNHPMTPGGSPENERKRMHPGAGQDKTRISSILGVDMEPMMR
ncbi:hypothetical protein HRG_007488 [Hirsutella rhossiliensis]|uniref:Myb-like domain-containing protein n=1 Tax=Hirsutella rhossiliensis TaxID=111463 RepID=A0A9P8MUD7_9HYPO|nr:uncharacterized protein HRG_07488 [Hirsutella rhossiliensis]KAH0961410.1 hypothetical protein HRG_07488 [Hirsutella rhossiliensis]